MWLKKDTFLSKFIEDVKGKGPEEAGKFFQNCKFLKKAHAKAVAGGDTEVVDDVAAHFIAFVVESGDLYELDGTKPFPINHGKCEKTELLAKSCDVIKTFMARDPEEIRFTMMAVAPPTGTEEEFSDSEEEGYQPLDEENEEKVEEKVEKW